LWTRSTAPHHAVKDALSAPSDDAPCVSDTNPAHTQASVDPKALPGKERPADFDSSTHAEPSSVHIAAASAVQEGFLEATGRQTAGLAEGAPSITAEHDLRGRKPVLSPIAAAPILPSAVGGVDLTPIPRIPEGAGSEPALPLSANACSP